jgi:hypothetical protein
MLPASPNDRRHTSGAMPAGPWIITGLVVALFVGAGMVWLAAEIASGDAVTVPSVGRLPGVLVRQDLATVLGPGGSPTRFYAALIGQGVLVLAAVVAGIVLRQRRKPRDGRGSLVAAAGFTDMQQPAMAKRAQGLRPSLAGTRTRDLSARQVGAALGEIGGQTVFKSHEDVELVICGPRSNKTSAKVVPEILAAPGTVIATSNKEDVWALTAGLRAKVGPVYLFDPNQITYQPQQFWWDPLNGVFDVDSASRLANYFMREVGANASGGTDRADPFFTPASTKTLRQLLLATTCDEQGFRTLRDVRMWVATRSDEPVALLSRRYAAQAAGLQATLELPPETRGGIYEGVATAIACLDSEPLLRWITPPSTWEQPPADPAAMIELELWSLLASPDGRYPTVYLLTREGQGTGRPVVAAIVGELLYAAGQAAAARGGRLDPPMTVQLDEAANIVRIPELPSWYSWFGSRGLMVTTVLQSREQGRAVWGKDGFEALWSAATIATVGAGVKDPEFAEDLSRLVGDHKIEETSTSYSTGTGHSVSRSLRGERILTAADIAALPRTHALLFSSSRRPGLLTLKPWYAETGEDKDAISTNVAQATQDIQHAAISFLGPNNPVAAALLAEQDGQR